MAASLIDQSLHSIHERHAQEVHRQVDGATTAATRAGVVPLDAGGQDLEVAARGAGMPTVRLIVLDRRERRVELDVSGKQGQRVAGRHLAEPRQGGWTE
jgi:hypothetical protein